MYEKQVRLSNPFSANFTKWSNTPKQFVGNLPTNCVSVFDHFVELALKEYKLDYIINGNENETENEK